MVWCQGLVTMNYPRLSSTAHLDSAVSAAQVQELVKQLGVDRVEILEWVKEHDAHVPDR